MDWLVDRVNDIAYWELHKDGDESNDMLLEGEHC